MKRLSLFLMVCGMIIATTSTGLAVEKFTVDGIDVILKTNPANEIVAVQFYLKGGVPYYGTDQAGMEEVLFRVAEEGTKNYPKEKLRSALSRMGTEISSNAGPDYTSITMQCLKRYFDESWDIYADVIVSPLCDAGDVKLAVERQLNDIRQNHADPDGYARLVGDQVFFRGHPYSVSADGTEETVAQCTPEALKAYHGEFVNKSRALIVIVGDVDKAEATKMIKAGFGSLPEGTYVPPELSPPGGYESVEHKVEERELPTTYVRGYFPTPSPDNVEDYVPMFVGLDILRDRLFEEVRTKRNLTYAVSSSMANRKHNYGLLYVTSTDPTQAMSVMLDEVDKMRTEPVPAKDLYDKVKVLTTETLMSEQTNSSQASQLALQEINGNGFHMADKRIELIQKVTPEEIQRVMKQYADGFNVVALGDTEVGQEMIEAVSSRN